MKNGVLIKKKITCPYNLPEISVLENTNKQMEWLSVTLLYTTHPPQSPSS